MKKMVAEYYNKAADDILKAARDSIGDNWFNMKSIEETLSEISYRIEMAQKFKKEIDKHVRYDDLGIDIDDRDASDSMTFYVRYKQEEEADEAMATLTAKIDRMITYMDIMKDGRDWAVKIEPDLGKVS